MSLAEDISLLINIRTECVMQAHTHTHTNTTTVLEPIAGTTKMTVGSVGCLAVGVEVTSSMVLCLCAHVQSKGPKGDQANEEEHSPPQIKT